MRKSSSKEEGGQRDGQGRQDGIPAGLKASQ